MARAKQRRVEKKPRTWKCQSSADLAANSRAASALGPGKRAIENADRPLIAGDIECSLPFDNAFRDGYPDKSRFDYLLVRHSDCAVVAVEVHPASSTGNVAELVAKKRGTLEIRDRERMGIMIERWHWVVAGQSTICFTQLDKYGLQLNKEGIQHPRRKIDIDR